MFKILVITLSSIFAYSISHAQKDTTNQTDANGLRQGYWVKQHENGNKAAEGFFKDGKQIGSFTHYHLDGKIPKVVIKHIQNTDTSYAEYFHENGYLMSKGMYINQKKEGLWAFSDNRQILSSKEEYKNDKQHGKTTIFHFDGSIAKEVYFENGLEQGDFKEFAPNGKVLIEGNYIDGNYNGIIKFYYSNGMIKTQGRYDHAVKNGRWLYHDTDGKVLVEENYENGILKGRVMSEETKTKAKALQEERLEQHLNGGNSEDE